MLKNCVEAVEALKLLLRGYQVAAVSGLPSKRLSTFLQLLEQRDVVFDAVYRDIRKVEWPMQDYSQVIKDFEISPEDVVARVLVIRRSFTLVARLFHRYRNR